MRSPRVIKKYQNSTGLMQKPTTGPDIDLDQSHTYPISLKWHFVFGVPTGHFQRSLFNITHGSLA